MYSSSACKLHPKVQRSQSELLRASLVKQLIHIPVDIVVYCFFQIRFSIILRPAKLGEMKAKHVYQYKPVQSESIKERSRHQAGLTNRWQLPELLNTRDINGACMQEGYRAFLHGYWSVVTKINLNWNRSVSKMKWSVRWNERPSVKGKLSAASA
jgi:hypothetical protein